MAQKTKRSTGREAKKTSSLTNEIIAVVICAVALLLGAFYYLPSSGVLGDQFIKPVSMGLFGLGTYLIPPVLLFIGLHMLIKRSVDAYRVKYILMAFFPLILGIICNFISFRAAEEMGIADFYAYGVQHRGGGFVSALITVPLIRVIGFAATIILLMAVAIIVIIYAFEFSIADFVGARIKRAKQRRAERTAQQTGHSAAFDKQKREEEFRKIAEEIKKEEDSVPLSAEPTIKIYGADDEEGGKGKKEKASSRGKKEPAEEEPLLIPTDNEYVEYQYPVIDLLETNPAFGKQGSTEDLKKNAKKLVDTLKSFGVDVTVLNIERGPTVTRYELAPSTGVKVSKITNLADDIALNLAARGVRIEAPIPGKAAVGIEVPNKEVTMVYLRDVIDTDVFRSCASKVAFALGKDISGNTVLGDIAKMPHLLIAGATGSGKSVCINTLITSILFKANPNEVKLLMIDPKMVELGVYNGIPHLLIPVVTDPKKAAGALNWAVSEMLNRYKLFAENNVRDLRGYNQIQLENEAPEQVLPQILVIIDELADLMMVSPHEVEDAICRLAQLARAAGMHLIIATQRPSVDVITGVIKANIPSRISFSVSSQVDSRTILDMAGAEKLLGRGDMLYFPIGEIKPIRLQGAFVSDKEVEKVVEFIRKSGEAHYDEDIIEHIEKGADNAPPKEHDDECDEFLNDAIELVVDNGEASVSLIQRKFKVGYARAARIVDQMEDRGIVSPPDGSKPRKVLISKMEYNEMLMSTPDVSQQETDA